ncbi:MAG: hypothetical protein R3F30_04465 [Planctomycetota bacterium]
MKPEENWMTPRQIDSPDDLAEVVRAVAEAVAVGDLRQINANDLPFSTSDDIRRINSTGPWPDYLELHFEEVRTGTRYRLVVETYHGTGGRWERA